MTTPGQGTVLRMTNETRGTALVTAGRVAETTAQRVVGLLRDRFLAEGDGLWIQRCNSIHSFWMKFEFDAVFLDRNLRVVHLIHSMRRGRISRLVFSAKTVLELPAETIARTGTQWGDQLSAQRSE